MAFFNAKFDKCGILKKALAFWKKQIGIEQKSGIEMAFLKNKINIHSTKI